VRAHGIALGRPLVPNSGRCRCAYSCGRSHVHSAPGIGRRGTPIGRRGILIRQSSTPNADTLERSHYLRSWCRLREHILLFRYAFTDLHAGQYRRAGGYLAFVILAVIAVTGDQPRPPASTTQNATSCAAAPASRSWAAGSSGAAKLTGHRGGPRGRSRPGVAAASAHRDQAPFGLPHRAATGYGVSPRAAGTRQPAPSPWPAATELPAWLSTVGCARSAVGPNLKSPHSPQPR
jgi:hypothetical protein